MISWEKSCIEVFPAFGMPQVQLGLHGIDNVETMPMEGNTQDMPCEPTLYLFPKFLCYMQHVETLMQNEC